MKYKIVPRVANVGVALNDYGYKNGCSKNDIASHLILLVY